MFFLICLAIIISRMLVYMFSHVSLCRGLVDLMWKISDGAGKTGADGLSVAFSTDK